MSFGADMVRIAAKTNRKLDQLARAVKISTFSGVINDSPVVSGRLRGNFQTSEGAPILGEIDRLDPSGQAAISDVINTVQPFSVSYITNNLPYAEIIDEKYAMIDRNILTTMNNIRRMVSDLNK